MTFNWLFYRCSFSDMLIILFIMNLQHHYNYYVFILQLIYIKLVFRHIYIYIYNSNFNSHAQFRGQDSWPDWGTSNTLQLWIEFCVQLVESFTQFSSGFQISLTREKWLRQFQILNISLNYSASIILSLGLRLCKL